MKALHSFSFDINILPLAMERARYGRLGKEVVLKQWLMFCAKVKKTSLHCKQMCKHAKKMHVTIHIT